MAGVTEKIEKWNAREVVASTDFMRGQFLAAKARQDLAASRARSFDSDVPMPGGPGDLLQFDGTPISGIEEAPTLSGASGFSVTVGAGSGFLWYPGYPSLTGDDSGYLVVRWPSGPVTHTNPDGTNARIDVIVATAAMVDTDPQSRNILIDPVARTITPQTVNKTSAPLATLSVIAGTPSATPAPPSVPVGALALFYVWVPAGAGSAASFAQCRATWRRVEYPLAAMSGVVSGFGWIWDLQTFPGGADSSLFGGGFHRILVDGEMMEFFGNLDSRFGNVKVDTANNPFTSAAPTAGKVYYLYACGGRHNPMPSFNTVDGILSPVTIAESLTPPNVTHGHPTANLTVNGRTVTPAGAVYVGMGYVYGGTTHRGNCIQAGDMTYFGSDGASLVAHTMGGTSWETMTLPLATPFSTKAAIYVDTSGTPVGSALQVVPDSGLALPPRGFSIATSVCTLVSGIGASKVAALGWLYGRPNPAFSLANVVVQTGHAGDVVSVAIQGVNHMIRMVGPSVNG